MLLAQQQGRAAARRRGYREVCIEAEPLRGDRVVEKPFDLTRLLGVVRELLPADLPSLRPPGTHRPRHLSPVIAAT